MRRFVGGPKLEKMRVTLNMIVSDTSYLDYIVLYLLTIGLIFYTK